MKNIPLVAIVGPTASGKSDLAMEIGKRFNGEIIAADSRTVYKGLDIGSAKPTKADQKQIPHHLIDVVTPDNVYTAADFKKDATRAIEAIGARGRVPIMVGGTGLYLDSVLFDYKFTAKPDTAKREALSKLSLTDLQELARNIGIVEDDINFKNRRHLQRAVEAGSVIKPDYKLRENTLVIGITVPREVLNKRISDRIDAMVKRGLIEEVTGLVDAYGYKNEAMTGIGYRAIGSYLKNELSLDEAIAMFKRGDYLLAKRQMTWFKRNKYIHWVDDVNNSVGLVTSFLNKK